MRIHRIAALALCLILHGAAAAQGMKGHDQHEQHRKHHAGASGHGTTRERPADLDVARTRMSKAHRFKVSIEPQQGAATINRMHAWLVTVQDPDGNPVDGADITVDGGMPEHGHGLPTAPQVSSHPDKGRYLLEGMRFSMTGWWTLDLGIRSGDVHDGVTFNIVLE